MDRKAEEEANTIMVKYGVDDFKEKQVEDTSVDDIATFCPNYESLRVHLGLLNPVEKRAVQDLKAKHTTEDQRRKDFLRDIWIAKKTDEATYGRLVFALLRTQRKQDAESVCEYIRDNLKGPLAGEMMDDDKTQTDDTRHCNTHELLHTMSEQHIEPLVNKETAEEDKRKKSDKRPNYRVLAYIVIPLGMLVLAALISTDTDALQKVPKFESAHQVASHVEKDTAAVGSKKVEKDTAAVGSKKVEKDTAAVGSKKVEKDTAAVGIKKAEKDTAAVESKMTPPPMPSTNKPKCLEIDKDDPRDIDLSRLLFLEYLHKGKVKQLRIREEIAGYWKDIGVLFGFDVNQIERNHNQGMGHSEDCCHQVA